MPKVSPVWPASWEHAADGPRLAEARGSLGHDRAHGGGLRRGLGPLATVLRGLGQLLPA